MWEVVSFEDWVICGEAPELRWGVGVWVSRCLGLLTSLIKFLFMDFDCLVGVVIGTKIRLWRTCLLSTKSLVTRCYFEGGCVHSTFDQLVLELMSPVYQKSLELVSPVDQKSLDLRPGSYSPIRSLAFTNSCRFHYILYTNPSRTKSFAKHS